MQKVNVTSEPEAIQTHVQYGITIHVGHAAYDIRPGII